jgi:capsid protein
MDWSQVNYSSARAALLEVARGYAGRKSKFSAQFMTPIYAAWLEEAIDMGRVRLPAGAPPFWAARAAYINADWIGPARGWVDPQKEAEAAGMRLSLGLSTLEREAADQGHDWMDLVNQRARERKALIAAGLDPDPGRVEARIQPSEAQPLPPEQVAEQTGEAPEREPGDPDNVA